MNKLELKVINSHLSNEEVAIVSAYIIDLGYNYSNHDYVDTNTLITYEKDPEFTDMLYRILN